ncbi:MAG: ATP-binding protein [Gaiellaceae bacterium]
MRWTPAPGGVNMEAVVAIGSNAMEEAAAARRRSGTGRFDNPVVRAVAQAPLSVRWKLLLGFGATAASLVVVGVLGIVALRDSNARVTRLGDLQARAAAAQAVQSDVAGYKALLVQRANMTPNAGTPIGRGARIAPSSFYVIDATINEALSTVLKAATLIEDSEPAFFKRAYALYGQLAALSQTALLRDDAGKGNRVGPLVRREVTLAGALEPIANAVAGRTQRQADALVAQNRHSFTASRDTFIGVAAGSLALAVLMGLVLSWSLIAPLRRTEARLAAIAGGDFTGRVDVPNRDEVGSLAANVNRMNDEIGRVYRELETISRHKSEFLATMSHELRTPLNAIIGFSEVLQAQMFGTLNEQQLSYVDDVLAAGRHLLALINDVLDLAKIEAGRMELDLGPVSLADVLQSGMTMHGERASRAGIALGLRVEPEEIVLTADDRRVRQVVFNLLSNAIKFTPRNGRVDVTARLRDGVVEVAVADTGRGIAPEDLERIFEEFDQGSGSAPDGTGLGLPLSRKFVELHGGRLWVESAVGAGSTFRFTLPVASEAMQWQTS